MIFTEIVLPDNVPREYKDRATLWNAVEKAESGKKARLAYSFDIAVRNELTMEENIALARLILVKGEVLFGVPEKTSIFHLTA